MALLIGGLGGAETARAEPRGLVPARFFAAADTDSVALPVRSDTRDRDSTATDTLGQTSVDSIRVSGQATPSAMDTIDVEQDSIPFPDRDEILSRLADMPGFRVIEYRGR